MTKSLKLWKVLGATFLSVGVISISAAAVSHNLSSKADVTEAADYYSGVTDSMTGTTLLNKLNSIINTGSESQNYDWSRFEAADEDPNNSSNVLMIYARTSVSKSAHVNNQVGWNREHTFPQSKLSLSTSEATNAKNDNHIVYASDCDVNGARSNLPMGVVTSGTSVTDSYGNSTTCKKTSSLFDPNNRARGIVARSTMYAAAMYGYDPEDNFESIYTMLKWHLDYPVDSFDTKRNTVVYANQKNRNPFVDHPEYACRIWGDTNSQTQSLCGSSSSTTVSVSLNKSSLSLAPGASETLTATTTGTGTLSWSTSNSSVATVSNGTVTVKSTATAGQTATITATYGTASDTCTVTVASSGSGSGESSGTLTITRNSFSSTASSYAWYDWTQDGVTGKAEIYPATATSMQFNKSKGNKVGAIYNTTALPGSITKIEATTASGGTNKSWNAYVTSTACSASGTTLTFGSNKTTVGSSVTVSTSSTSFGTSSAGYKYFCLQESDTSASYLSEIKITYNASSSTKTLSSIAVKTAPTKITYTAGEYFAPAGLVITATYSDSSTEDISYASNSSAFTFSPTTSTALTTSNASVTISYGGKSCSQAITVNAASVTLSSISVSTAPTKTTYTAGETFDPTGLVITRTYSNSTSDTYAYAGHTSEFSFSPSTSTALTTANTSVTITYSGKSCNQAITVNASGGSSSSEWIVSSSAYKTAKFGNGYNSKGTQSYTDNSWSSTYNSFTVNITNANNNNNGWNFIKIGGKNGAYTGTITTAAAIDKAIGKVSLTIDAITTSNVTSIKLYKSTNGSTWTEVDTFTKASGTQSINLEEPTTNLYYKIEVVCTTGSSNGLITISQIDFYDATEASSSSPVLTGITLNTSNVQTNFAVNDTFTYSGLVVTANYSDSSYDEVVSSGYTVSTPDMTTAGPKEITVTYSGKSATYNIQVSMVAETDDITLATTGVTSGSTSYSNWSQSVTSTGAVYSGNSAGGNSSIQLRSSNNSGIVQTTSGGHVNKITVVWNSNTSNGRVINVYGKSSAYSTPSDLYTTSTQGILIGTITYGTSSTLEISSVYSFIGIRSNSGAIYLDSITVEYKTAEWWAENFLNKVTCNNGVTPPSSSNWISTNTDYYAKLPTSEQNIIKATVGNQGGTTLQQAMARYVEVLSKYSNRTSYPDYIFNPSSANQMSRVNNNASSATIILLTVGILSSFAGFAFVGYWLKKKREY